MTQKENRKSNFFPWVKFKEKRVFPVLKRICLFSSLFVPTWYLIGEKESYSAAKENVEPMWYLIGEKEF